jgi:hypothetical protein
MHLSDAQLAAWSGLADLPETTRDAMGQLAETSRRCMEAYGEDRLVEAQMALEDTLLRTFIAMKSMGINAEDGMKRALARLEAQSKEQRVFHIFPDRVEILVGSESRGGWPLYTEEDLELALQTAQSLGCDVEYRDGRQLGIFVSPTGAGALPD